MTEPEVEAGEEVEDEGAGNESPGVHDRDDVEGRLGNNDW